MGNGEADEHIIMLIITIACIIAIALGCTEILYIFQLYV